MIADVSMTQVCGRNSRTYPSVCHLLQQSNTQLRFPGACNRTDCPDRPVSITSVLCDVLNIASHYSLCTAVSQVCGTDGVTYPSICDLRVQAEIRLDYEGE